MRRTTRQILYMESAAMFVSAAVRGQQSKPHHEPSEQPSAAWRKVSERKVALPPGVMLAVRLIDRVSSDRNQAGDRFEGTLDTSVVVDGRLVVDKGTPVAGRVVRARKAGRMTAPSELVLELVELVCPSGRVAIETDAIERGGETSSRTGDTVAIGSTAALGTALGAIGGGGKGAAIGATVGGAADTGGTLGAKGKATVVNSEAVLLFRLRSAATVRRRRLKRLQSESCPSGMMAVAHT